MNNSIKIIGVIVSMALAASPFATAQSKGKSDAGTEARESAEQRAKAAQPAEAREKVEQATTRTEAAPQPAKGEPKKTAEAGQREKSAQAKQGGTGREGAMERQSARFGETHERRMAQLQRLRDLAAENDREEAVARVDKLIERERAHHAKKIQRVQDRGSRPAQDRPAKDQPATKPNN